MTLRSSASELTRARSYAAGAADALSVADAYDGHDNTRRARAIADARANLLNACRALRSARGPRRNLASAALALPLMVAPWVLTALLQVPVQ